MRRHLTLTKGFIAEHSPRAGPESSWNELVLTRSCDLHAKVGCDGVGSYEEIKVDVPIGVGPPRSKYEYEAPELQVIRKADAQLTDEEKATLKSSFDTIDIDGSGTIDQKEFNGAMKLAFASRSWLEHPDKLETPSDETLDAEFKKCDTDGNGTIELEEFYAVFTAIKRGEDGGLLGKMGGGFAAVLGDVADGAVAGAKFAWTPFAFAWGATGGKVVEAVSGEAEAVRVGVRVHDKCENCQSLYEAKGGCALM